MQGLPEAAQQMHDCLRLVLQPLEASDQKDVQDFWDQGVDMTTLKPAASTQESPYNGMPVQPKRNGIATGGL